MPLLNIKPNNKVKIKNTNIKIGSFNPSTYANIGGTNSNIKNGIVAFYDTVGGIVDRSGNSSDLIGVNRPPIQSYPGLFCLQGSYFHNPNISFSNNREFSIHIAYVNSVTPRQNTPFIYTGKVGENNNKSLGIFSENNTSYKLRYSLFSSNPADSRVIGSTPTKWPYDYVQTSIIITAKRDRLGSSTFRFYSFIDGDFDTKTDIRDAWVNSNGIILGITPQNNPGFTEHTQYTRVGIWNRQLNFSEVQYLTSGLGLTDGWDQL